MNKSSLFTVGKNWRRSAGISRLLVIFIGVALFSILAARADLQTVWQIGIDDDPLKAVRDENAKLHPEIAGAMTDGKPKQRAVWITSDEPDIGDRGGIQWSANGHALAIQLLSIDNKDRWLATVDFSNFSLITQHRLTDGAWINASQARMQARRKSREIF